MSINAAAREVGVSRSTGANWSRGYKTYRRGQVTGFVPPLERLAVRDISARFLSQEERIEIADLRHAGLSMRQIAARMGRAPSTISRELRRNASGGGGYRPFEAHRQATARRAAAVPGASRPAASCAASSASCWPSGGARSRSAATCACGSPASGTCGCVTRAPARPSTSPAHR